MQFIEKTPAAIIPYVVDFADEIPSGDSILSGIGATGATAADSIGSDATSTVITSATVSGTTLELVLKAGSDWETYTITVTAEMTTANTKIIKQFQLRVRSSLR